MPIKVFPKKIFVEEKCKAIEIAKLDQVNLIF